MRKIWYSPEALNDLKRIRARIIDIFEDESIAVRCLKELMDQIDQLIYFPGMGRELRKTLGMDTDYRCLFCKPDYVFYRVEGDVIKIIAVINEKEDYVQILFGKKTEQ